MKRYYFALTLLFIILLCIPCNAQPRIWNIKTIDSAKLSATEASKAVIREADKNINSEIATVMDKPLVPPSGDKHDYMSMGRYWWPNPKTADGLPYIRKDGVVNPEIDKLDRMPLARFARSICTLSVAYYLTNNEKYAAKAVENLRIWFINKNTKMNPNMNFGQTIPGRNHGKGRGEGVLDTYSFVEMLDGVELLKNSKKLTSSDREAIKNWFTDYLSWLLNSEIGNEEYNAKNNHGIAFDVQIVRFALFSGKDDIARKFVSEFTAKRIFKQIEPNGAQPLELERTTAFGYSVFNLTHMLDMATIAKTMGVDLFNSTSEDGKSITKAIEFLLPYLGKPQSEFPYKQIKDWEKVQTEFCWQLIRADGFKSTPVYKKIYSEYIPLTGKDNNYLLY
jgi:hypothetical protein